MKLTDEQKQELKDKWLNEMAYTLENKHIDSSAYFDWWLSQIEQLEVEMPTDEEIMKEFSTASMKMRSQLKSKI